MKKVLVVGAHPDDETLGCGATIARHTDAGDQVDVLILADGEQARGTQDSVRLVQERSQHAQQAMNVLGAREPRQHQFPDNRLDGVDLLDLVQVVEAVLDEIQPVIVYTHHAGDLNIDHRLTHEAVITACRPVPGACVDEIYAFEVPSSTEWRFSASEQFVPNHFIDVSKTLSRKLAALEVYEREMRPFPHPRSSEAVRALAAWRGANVGLAAAEAFMTVRRIVRT